MYFIIRVQTYCISFATSKRKDGAWNILIVFPYRNNKLGITSAIQRVAKVWKRLITNLPPVILTSMESADTKVSNKVATFIGIGIRLLHWKAIPFEEVAAV